jgi:hypothetical protein
VHQGGKTFQDKAGESHIGALIPPINDSFSFHMQSMHLQNRLGTGAYLEVRRYTTFDARTYAPHRHGARLGFIDLARYSKLPRSAQQFRAEIWYQPLPQSPDNPASPAGHHSFALGCFIVYSPDVPKDGRRDQIQHSQKHPASYHLWENKMLQLPGHMDRERDNNIIGASHLSPSDSVIATFGNKGMRRHLGTESRPPAALRYSHVAFNQ